MIRVKCEIWPEDDQAGQPAAPEKKAMSSMARPLKAFMVKHEGDASLLHVSVPFDVGSMEISICDVIACARFRGFRKLSDCSAVRLEEVARLVAGFEGVFVWWNCEGLTEDSKESL